MTDTNKKNCYHLDDESQIDAAFHSIAEAVKAREEWLHTVMGIQCNSNNEDGQTPSDSNTLFCFLPEPIVELGTPYNLRSDVD